MSVEAWTDALILVAYDEVTRGELRERGLARAQHFSWDRCAQQTLDALREAAADPVSAGARRPEDTSAG
jgi:glycosyltransferase involved in cell wall biosynthesis